MSYYDPQHFAHRCIGDAGHGPRCGVKVSVERRERVMLSVSKLGAGQEGYYLDAVALRRSRVPERAAKNRVITA